MALNLRTICLVVALVLFLLSACNVPSRIGLQSLGLAFGALAALVS